MNINVMFRSIFCMRLFLKTIFFFPLFGQFVWQLKSTAYGRQSLYWVFSFVEPVSEMELIPAMVGIAAHKRWTEYVPGEYCPLQRTDPSCLGRQS